MPNPQAEPTIPRANEVMVGSYRPDVELPATQKFVKVIRIKSAQEILKDGHIKLLTKINNEAKVRRSTRSVVLANAKKGNGEGQVVSYE